MLVLFLASLLRNIVGSVIYDYALSYIYGGVSHILASIYLYILTDATQSLFSYRIAICFVPYSTLKD